MFRRPFALQRQHRHQGNDPNSNDEEQQLIPMRIKPIAPDGRPSSAAPSITDRSAKDPLGLKVVHRPLKERKVDIIFVHGLGGGSRMTWAKDHNLDNFWPLEFLPLEPEIGDARIMTFGYNAKFKPGGGGSKSMSLLDFAKELLYDLKYATDESSPDLEGLNLGQKPIIFLAHSMGGLVIKEAYMQGKDDPKYAAIINAISSIIFLSTPHRGTNLAETLNRILRVSLVATPMQFIVELASGSQMLQKLNESFRHVAEKLDIISFYETRPTALIKSTTSIMVLEKESSVLGYPGEVSKPLDADHNGICKYNGPDDPRYITVRNALKHLIAKASSNGERGSLSRHADLNGNKESTWRDHHYHGAVTRRISATDELPDQSSATETSQEILEEYLSSAESPNQDFNFFRDRWTVGTCQWILNNQVFSSWLEDNRASPRVLWFQGNAASGKSIMSSFIIDKLVRDGLPCYYFFLRFNDQKKRSIGALLRSLAAQMANSIPTYAHKLVEVVSVAANLRTADFRSTWQWFFKDILFSLGDELKNPIYWVIDGLDEADAPATLIRLLADMDVKAANIPLRVLIASRKTHEISSAFLRLGRRMAFDTTRIEGSREDLLAYVEQELDFTEESEYRDQVVAQLLERAGGNFLWLHLAVNKINQCHTKLGVERALEDLPSGMQDLYDRMASLVQNQPNNSDRRLGQSVLGWATCARRSITSEELRDALGGTGDTNEILDIHRTVEDLCGGFVVVDNDGKIAMLHETAREYLTGLASCQSTGRSCVIDTRTTHDLLFKRCITCLSQPDLRSRISRGEPPALLNYAISSWYIHLSKGTCTDPNPEILDALVRFLQSPHILVWISSAAAQNALQFLVTASRYLTNVVLALQRFQDEIEPLNQHQTTEVIEDWATDLIKIVGKFGKNLRRDPESIYRRIPPFCPLPSMIYQQFGKNKSRTLQVSGLATAKWDDSIARFTFEAGVLPSAVLNAGSRVVILTMVRRNSTILIYNDATFEEQRRMKHDEWVLMMQVNKSGTLLVTYGYKTTRIWDILTGDCIRVANNPNTLPRPQAITFFDDGILMSSADRRIRTLSINRDTNASADWVLKSQVEEQGQVLRGVIANSPTCSAISHDGRMVAYGYRGHPITVWEVEPTAFFSEIMLDADEAIDMLEVVSIRWHPLRYEIFCLSNVGVLFKWDPEYDRAEFMTYARADKFNISHNGSLVVAGNATGTIKVYATVDLSLLCQLHSQDSILGLSFSSDSRRLYDIRNHYGIVWEPDALVRLAEKSQDPESNTDLDFIDDNGRPAKPSPCLEHTSARLHIIKPLARQQTGSLYCYGTEDGVSILGEIGRGDVGEIARSTSCLPVDNMAWSKDGQLLAISDIGGRLLLKHVVRLSNEWTIQHKHNLVISPSQGHITHLIFHPSGNRLLATTPKTLHFVNLETWEVNSKPSPVDCETDIKWTCHPTIPDYILGFSSTCVSIISWTTLEELGVQTYMPSQTANNSERVPVNLSEPRVLNSRHKADRHRLGRLLSGQGLPQILLETYHVATAGESAREFLIFETTDINPSPGDEMTGLSYTTLPEYVSLRIREPLAFLPRRRLAYLDRDKWICTFRLSTRPNLHASRLLGTASPSLPSNVPARQEHVHQLSDMMVERHYFLREDWAMANEIHLCAMAPDGALLCPQSGGIASVQSASLGR
ncbi:hypothetical protein B0I35DRAFT_393986 [Stachybotrys elegans]|uniref:NACHT domain-containing protein n=1 Tax=Stachybotrys elegans TaxID=80388 RepID=A0A8K0SRE8_9HYPO|nr:hypothetical protein B0I35DRAFT_393986 [Stachybotrys elegans]